MIQAEGVESLSEAELREDCRERGMLGLRSVEEMRQQVLSFSFLFSCHFWIHSALLCLGLSICIQTDAFSLNSVQLHRLLSIECGCDFSYQPQWFYILETLCSGSIGGFFAESSCLNKQFCITCCSTKGVLWYNRTSPSNPMALPT